MRLVWAPAAQDDVLDIAEYYDRLDPDLADEVVRRLETAPLPLADFARLGEAVGGDGVRERSIAGTLYVVLDDRVEVRRVVHAASDWRP